MSRCQAVARPLARQLRPQTLSRPFTTGTAFRADVQESTSSTQPPAAAEPAPSPQDLDPNTVLPQFETALMKTGASPIGSRRRRLAIRTTTDIPFEQLPYQAFQEARKILAADREEKIAKIKIESEKLAKLRATDAGEIKGGQQAKDAKILGLSRLVERLKILADINDPVVKKRFEDGLGDMTKPIYRHYAAEKWRSYDERLIQQRISQFKIVPDVLAKLEPTADVKLHFRQKKVAPGDIVDSSISEFAPRLRVQVFDNKERLMSIVVMDSDVPNPEEDSFNKRCHFMAANIPVNPLTTSFPLGKIKADDQLAVPWLPPFAQKGAPYHRMSIFLLEQAPGERLDIAKLKELYASEDETKFTQTFSLKSFRDKFNLKPFGFNMFRTVWDESTADLMARHKMPGAETEFRPARVYSLKPPVKPRGWEAKRQGPKYRQLWKYTKRIRGISNGRGWTKRR